MSFAFVFPGQGSQSVGMLAGLAATDAVVRATFDEASSALGYDLWTVVQEGPAERLNATEVTQPAMLAAGIATARLWSHRGGAEPTVVAGHSLGEFTALVAAGALDFSTAIELVKFRGQVMQEAVPLGEGAMAVIIGLEDAEVEAVCREAAQGAVVEAVNFNSPGQVAIAGAAAAVQRAMEAAKAKGAKRAMPLAVSVPSHSSLMNGAAERLAERLADVEIRAPRFRYISSVDAVAHADPADIRTLLGSQLARPVRWQDTVRAIAATEVAQLIECGPGKVLTGLSKRVEGVSGVTFAALEDPASLDAALAATKGS
ncbi:MAG TPA: ACP S-malonyltransferase [Steroidobacteraceae bacterium]|jgi:[acyl-carrier-protein] S-malonyltransferase|nr:ACP S-malonyltransferase [Steroidobacteraceae bacterium]